MSSAPGGPRPARASTFRERLAAGPPLLLDGGMGTMLIACGLQPGEAPELWNETRADLVLAAHRAYVDAGCEAVHANSFGANACRLRRHGLADALPQLNAAAVRLARQSGAAWVIGDVGPTGEYLLPMGTADPAAWRATFMAQAHALAAAGVDALHVETMSDRREATLALAALRAAAPGLPVMVSMTFEQRRRGFFTMMGDPLAASLQALVAAGADAVGANCSIASPAMRALAQAALPVLDRPFVCQPNAGAPRTADGGFVYDQSPEAFADDMAAIAAMGARAVGGCCGTDPRFLAALRRRLGARVAP
jgi:5-methyltetrahydrofolate--homocysteine methyltransferase